MKVLMINGSPREKGNTFITLSEMAGVFEQEGIDTEIFSIGKQERRGCAACGYCYKNGKCVYDDDVNECAKKFEEADGLVIGSPVYYASPNGSLLAFLDRLFYSTSFDKSFKCGAAVVCARRGGLSSSFDVLNKYFTICGMPVVSSYYWNSVHGAAPGEAFMDEEGIFVAKALAKNMSFLIKSISLGKEKYGLPEKGRKPATNFIR